MTWGAGVGNLPQQLVHVGDSISPTARRMPQSGAPSLITRWERLVDWVEVICEQGIRHGRTLTVRRRNRNGFIADELSRRVGIGSPIPVR